jgi:chromosome segregation ATPase
MSKNIINEYVRNFDDLVDVIQKIGREYEELKEQVISQDKIEDMRCDIINLEDKLSDSVDENRDLRDEIKDLKDEISNLEAQIEKLQNVTQL